MMRTDLTKFEALIDGVRVETPAQWFAYWVDNVRFWFALHPSLEGAGQLTVSHWATGAAVCRFTAAGAMDFELARVELDQLVHRVGAIQVAKRLLAAERTPQPADLRADEPTA